MEITKIERGADFDLFSATAGCQVVGDKRKANDDECRAYARWLAMRAGIVEAVTNSPKLEWRMTDRRNSVCIGAYFGDAFIAFPGADQNGAVTFELLDESGNVETSGTIYAKPNGALNIAAADAQAMKESGKAWAKANKGKVKEKRDDGGFSKRVNYAAGVISARRNTSRAFDNCFENFDGDAVVYALIERAKKNEALAANLPRYICAQSLQDLAGRFDGLDLIDVAISMQERAKNPPIAEPAPVATLSDELINRLIPILDGNGEPAMIDKLQYDRCEPYLHTYDTLGSMRTTKKGGKKYSYQVSWSTADEYFATQTAEEAPQDDAPATALAGMPEIAPQDEKNGLPDDIEAQPDPIAALMARMDALEAMLASPTPIAAIETNAPLSGELRAKRSPAHVRAIMAYLAMRKERNAERKHNAIGMQQLEAMRADRDRLAIQQANAREAATRYMKEMERADASERQIAHKHRCAIKLAMKIRATRNRHRDISRDRFAHLREYFDKATTAETCARAAESREAALKTELASLKAKIADPSNPVRESDLVMLKGNAEAWQAKAERAIAESERLKRLAVQNAGHIETLASRVARAEAMLRESGALPVLTLVPPTASVAA